ncbi:MAG: NGG1p interacting factor NIF3 [Candidatus Omnitrophota bacterium]|nr:NGG1p interacting factor NIF3 [Candidatus Omnitrophota bacterium]
MNLGKFYELIVKFGSQADLRGKSFLVKELKKLKLSYRKLKKEDKKFFDLESLKNPFSDSRLLFGDAKTEIKKILVGIDIDVAELLLADKIRSMGKRIDLVMAHHPQGIALAGLPEVMFLQINLLEKQGIPFDIAKDFMEKRIKEVERRVLSANHSRVVDAAKLLGIPFICAHTVADNFVCCFLQQLMDKRKPKTLGDILKILLQIPEYRLAALNKSGPKILSGDSKSKAGKIFVDMTGGTEGSKELFGRLSQAGIQTIIAMHLSEEHFAKIKDEHINVIIAGHIASDAIGLNLLLDRLEKYAKFEIMGCSGFRRFKR